ncbi:hypothetical protein [Clostridium sp. Marseille-P2415]|uniref:hypothetical protein n=1 Tax=Clostridium sp. Marseille-P2415 TaxID=1805471 RepID=UPI00098890F5|nr:hypothetical protein [Clostridium sp. Marseille-P2415]
MSSFNEALRKAGIGTDHKNDYNKKKAGAFTLELKLYEMKDHIAAICSRNKESKASGCVTLHP